MTTFKPGDIVRHPLSGRGIVVQKDFGPDGSLLVEYAHPTIGVACSTSNLTGWERVETLPAGYVAIRTDDIDLNHPEGVRALWMRVQRLTTDPASHDTYEEWAAANNSRSGEVLKPGHVQVRVDDLAPQTLFAWSQYPGRASITSALKRMGQAFISQQVERGDPPAAQCDAAARFTSGPNAETPPVDDEQPASATVTLPCPDCGESITSKVVVRLDPNALSGGYYLGFDEAVVRNHRCPPDKPAQPDEPTDFGARVTITRDGEAHGRWLRSGVAPRPFVEQGVTPESPREPENPEILADSEVPNLTMDAPREVKVTVDASALARFSREAARKVLKADRVPSSDEDAPEEVSHPAHYTGRNVACRECAAPVECIQVSETFGFNLGNVVKYLWRAGAKGDRLTDLQKAAQYLEFEITRERRTREAEAMAAAGEWDGVER